MYLKSPYPDLPATSEGNVHHFLWNRPDQVNWPKDFTFHIDARTGKKRTYREFLERVRLGATALGASAPEGGLGIRGENGEVVGIISQNSSDYVTLVHSLLMITTPFSLISPYPTPYELRHALQLTTPTRLFVNARILPLVLPVAKETGIPLERIYVLGGNVKGRRSFKEMIEETRSRKALTVSPRPATKDTLAYLVFSSGTSGLPKAVMISHGNIISSLQQFKIFGEVAAEVFPPQTPEEIPINLAVLPIHHSYGLTICCFAAFLRPATYVILDQWNLEVALAAIPKYKIAHFPLVPSLIHQIVNYPGIKEVDLSSLRGAGSGAAYIPPDLSAKLAALLPQTCDCSDGYGMSEITNAAIFQPVPGSLNGTMKRIIGSPGVLLSSLEARIVRDDGSEADVDEVGELYLRGKTVALGYWKNEKATRETFVDDWLRTGDRFRVNEDGHFFFADRIKDTLKVSGMQVSPTEIENVLLNEPGKLIADVSVVGVSGGRTSDEKVPRAWIVLSSAGKRLGAAATIEALEKWHRETLSKYKWLRGGFEVVDEIPKSPTGKVLRRILQDRYERNIVRKVEGKL